MNNTTTTVHVVQTKENLLGYLLDEVHGHTLVLVTLDQTKQVFTQNLKNHADVNTVGAFMAEVVEKGNDM